MSDDIKLKTYLRFDQISARFGNCNRMWIARRIQRDGFPQPVRFGTSSAVFWLLTEVEAWESKGGV